MPNWCLSRFAFKGDKEELKNFNDKIRYFTSSENKNQIENGFGPNWLGNVVHGFGFNWERISCRGALNMPEKEFDPEKDKYLMVETDTAWAPMPEMWDIILSRFYPSLSYVFTAFEEGCGLYINTDIEHTIFPERYYVSVYDPINNEFDSEFCESKEELKEYLKSLKKTDEYNVFEFEEYYGK